MLKKFIEKTKKVLSKYGETLKAIAVALIIAYYNLPVTVYASGDTTYLKPINNLKTIGVSIVAAAGVIVLLFGGVRFAMAFQKMDQNGEHSAVYTMIAGGIMIGISGILAVLTS